MNELNSLINNPNLSITVKASELKATFADIVEDAIDRYKREVTTKPQDILYTPKQVCEILSIDKSTLWRWGKIDYLCGIKVGDSVRYRKSQIDDIINAKGGANE
ncbi:MAG: helix-turn-helix domain-containing protein [Rikenellaceae bacterium]